MTPLIAPGRDRHNRSWRERPADPPPAPETRTPLEAMLHRLATPGGRRRTHGLRKRTPEPVFGVIESVVGFRRFHLRGLDSEKGAWNMMRMFALRLA